MTFESLAAKAMNAVALRQHRLHVEAAATTPAELTESRFLAAATSRPPVLRADPPGAAEMPADDAAFETKVLMLASWPQMRAVPAELLAIYARVCALLAYSPSVGFLVHRRLGLESMEVLPVLRALHEAGHLRVTTGDAHHQSDVQGDAIAVEASIDAQVEPPPRNTLWTRLLAKLLH